MRCEHCGVDLTPLEDYCRGCGRKTADGSASSPSGEHPSMVARPGGHVGDTAARVATPEGRASSNRWGVGLSIAMFLGGATWLYASPYITLWRFQSAVTRGDAAAVGELVSWDEFRTSVKGEVRTVLQTVLQRDAPGPRIPTDTALVGGLGSAMSDRFVDQVVTRETLANLVSGSESGSSDLGFLINAFGASLQTVMRSKSGEAGDWKALVSQRVKLTTGYSSFGQFEVGISATLDEQPKPLQVGRVILRRTGLGWTVAGVQFAQEVLALVDTIETSANADDAESGQQAIRPDTSPNMATDAVSPSDAVGEPSSPAGEHEETIIVRSYEVNRDFTATLTADRLDFDQASMNFVVTPEDDQLHEFLKSHLNVPLVVRWRDEPQPFFVTAAREKP
jgi:hypothetical protein